MLNWINVTHSLLCFSPLFIQASQLRAKYISWVSEQVHWNFKCYFKSKLLQCGTHKYSLLISLPRHSNRMFALGLKGYFGILAMRWFYIRADSHRFPIIVLTQVSISLRATANFLHTEHREVQMVSTSSSDSGEVDKGPHLPKYEVSL